MLRFLLKNYHPLIKVLLKSALRDYFKNSENELETIVTACRIQVSVTDRNYIRNW